MILYFVVLIMTVMGSVASLFLKKASSCDGIVLMLKNINLYIGGFLYVGSAVLNIILLRYMDYSVVLPLTSFTYIWTMVISYWILKEKISLKKKMGLFMILLGAVILTR